MGGADYSHLMPSNSYIDVLNFSSPKALAEYIKEVGSDEKKYESYFEWKKEYYSYDYGWDFFYDLCQKLKTEASHYKVKSHSKPRAHHDLMKWWVDDSHCVKPLQFNPFRFAPLL